MAASRKSSGVMPAVRVPQTTHGKLQELAKTEERSMGEIVTELVEKYEQERFWEEANASLERLRADPVAWQDYMDEVALWDNLSNDGLENEPPYYTPEEEEKIRASAGQS